MCIKGQLMEKNYIRNRWKERTKLQHSKFSEVRSSTGAGWSLSSSEELNF